MSHFSKVKTKIKDKDTLLKALVLLGEKVGLDKELRVGGNHGVGHETVQVEVNLGKDIGFRWNKEDNIYELITDLQTWNKPISVQRFLDKITQQYALQTVTKSAEEEGFTVESIKTNPQNNSIDIVATRWT